jgi:ArsR family transcriptional regulator, virulence genes transcriptional regulator
MQHKLSIQKIKNSCEEVCLILKALSHPQRLVILGYLLEGSKTVSELVALCDTSQSQISQFLIRMKLEGLVKSEKDGKYQVYSLTDKRLVRLMKTIQTEYCKG